MTEYSTKAVILGREPKGEFDEVLTLYSKDFGKISALAKGVRKITSKLYGHLQVGGLSTVRLIRKGGIQLLEAFSHGSELNEGLYSFLGFIEQMTPFEAPDLHLWYGIEYVFESGVFTTGTRELQNRVYRRFLEIFGFGAKFAKCGNCGSSGIAYFAPSDIMFLCSDSLKKLALPIHEVISI